MFHTCTLNFLKREIQENSSSFCGLFQELIHHEAKRSWKIKWACSDGGLLLHQSMTNSTAPTCLCFHVKCWVWYFCPLPPTLSLFWYSIPEGKHLGSAIPSLILLLHDDRKVHPRYCESWQLHKGNNSAPVTAQMMRYLLSLGNGFALSQSLPIL